jgi:hypothetical protein
VIFEDCDFTDLPAEHHSRLRAYDPKNPADRRVYIGGV